ncbi:uncharacterized protein MELLADRAFT_88606 [Melampsora larici-populina 98AG31]|uniref:Alpha-type protein kinase domain-containing protein n=1 Tax=Melampsora larici-populina (strain 98AG31 / pathotype 3-4-7) TaxID=747676 RepID=F4RSC2_MELLP|nr:uncharacterized protein MELLADRAFT_88606 [Melampsora larici-populina 98AG31]EGG04571.1 hypothetical protein MELLADRAFT_88606 [Melampsora larici-populina 98AG31]
MPDSPYIGRNYRRVPPHNHLPLPNPALGGQVGLSCPNCPPSNNRSLVHFPGGEDSIKVRCETVKHYYRTFKLNQLNHEIALINAGQKYPIAFDRSAHGPPVNLQGAVVPARTSNRAHHATSSTSTQPKRGPPSIECARSGQGPTSGKHKKWGHVGCTLRYCKSCCNAYGPPGACYVHRTKSATSTTTTRQAAQATSPPSGDNMAPPANLLATPPGHHHPSPPADLPKAKRPRVIPQCSQSIHRVGRLLDDDSALVLERARQAQAEAHKRASQASAPSAVKGKVISLHLVTNEPRTPVISHIFPTWPVATLDHCSSLVRQAKEAAGAQWDGSLLIWDKDIKNWVRRLCNRCMRARADQLLFIPIFLKREVPVTLPHRYIDTLQNLIICVPSQRLALAHELQDALEGLGMGKPSIPKVPTESTETTATIVNKSPVIQASAKPTTSQKTYGSSLDPICFLDDLDTESETPRNLSSSSPTATRPSTPESLLALPSNKEEPPLNNDIHQPQVTTSLREWPGDDVLFSSVLEWYQSASQRGIRIPQWKVTFGSMHELHEPTAYRYFAWVKHTGYVRMMNWLKGWPDGGEINPQNVTVSRARRHFQEEFNAGTGALEPINIRGFGGTPISSSIYPSGLSSVFAFETISHLKFFFPFSSSQYNFSLGFASPALYLTDSEELGWQALPFDEPKDDSRDLVFGYERRMGKGVTWTDVDSYKWGFYHVKVSVNDHIWTCYDGRNTHPAVWRQGFSRIILEAMALEQSKNNIGDHLQFAQCLTHADCLLQKFKTIVQQRGMLTVSQRTILNSLRAHAASRNHSWFNLREPVESPEYITSDCQFGPQHRAPGFLGSLLHCFTHWTYEYHGRLGLICGFRGSNGIISELSIMDTARGWFLDNPGTAALQLFASNHMCESLCKEVGLIAPPPFYSAEGSA